MTDVTLEALREELAPIRAATEALREELAPIRAAIADLEGAIAKVQADVAAMRPNVEGIPLIQRAVSVIQQEQRMIKAAVNDLARTQFTSGEVEALHTDVNAVQATHMELETRILALERQVKELLEKR